MDSASKTSGDIHLRVHSSLKNKIEDAALALSLANLCFLKISFDLLSDRDRFFDKLPVTPSMLLAFMVNLVGLTLFIWLVIRLRRRLRSIVILLVIDFIFFLLLLYPIDFIRIKFFNVGDAQVFRFVTSPPILACAALGIFLFIWKHRVFVRIAASVVAILSPLAVFFLAKAMLVIMGIVHLRSCGHIATPPSLLPTRPNQPRVLWIIFDETDYRIAFEQRPPNLDLPEFDRLRNESLNSTAAYPPADGTILSMPSLLTGIRVVHTDANDSCDATLTFADSGQKAYWGDLESVFSDARSLGNNTALVGWYLPYSRVMGDSLNYCSWYSYPWYEQPRAERFMDELLIQLESFGETYFVRKAYIDVQQRTLSDALSIVGKSRFQLTLLHMPAPHGPGTWLPTKHEFTALPMRKTTGYMNGLSLANDELGKIRSAMEAAKLWQKTWIILSADHSWRASQAYDNIRDLRVPFIVKPPGDNKSEVYSNKFNTVLTRNLIDSIFRGQTTNSESLRHWLDVNAAKQHDVTIASGH